MYNIVSVNIFIFLSEQAYKKFIHLSRHFGCVKKQPENSLQLFATICRKLAELNEKFAFCE